MPKCGTCKYYCNGLCLRRDYHVLENYVACVEHESSAQVYKEIREAFKELMLDDDDLEE